MFDLVIKYVLGGIPTWLWPLTAGVGIGIYIISRLAARLPNVKIYTYITVPVSVLLILFGVFMSGGSGVVSVYQAQIKDMEHKLALAEQKSQQTNTVIQKVYVDRIKTIHDTKIVIQQQLQKDSAKIDRECKVDPAAVAILNQAAQGAVK